MAVPFTDLFSCPLVLRSRCHSIEREEMRMETSAVQSAFLSASGAYLKRDFVYDVTGAELIYPFIWSDPLCVGS